MIIHKAVRESQGDEGKRQKGKVKRTFRSYEPCYKQGRGERRSWRRLRLGLGLGKGWWGRTERTGVIIADRRGRKKDDGDKDGDKWGK